MPSSWKPSEKCTYSTPCATPSKYTAASRPAATADWLRLLSIAEPGVRTWAIALEKAGNPRALLDTLRSRSGKARTFVKTASRDERLARWHAWLAEPGHSLVTLGSESYPPALAATDCPPLALWCDGARHELLGTPQIAIVGARRPTVSGYNTAYSFAKDLSVAGITVTSGLALGIDAAAHEGALEGSGSTVAVLGSGIDLIYPRRNTQLAKRIRELGIVVSEYPPGHATQAFQFPARNRIIAGLSLGTLVVEAARRSGSLITARLAAECGRDVFALPGSIHSDLSKGCHRLLRDGAMLVEEAQEIIGELATSLRASLVTRPDQNQSGLSSLERLQNEPDRARRKLLQLLDFAPATAQELLSGSGLTAAELSSMLLHLEMEGTVEALPGGRYCRLAKRN